MRQLIHDIEVVADGSAHAFEESFSASSKQAMRSANNARSFAQRCDAHFSWNDPNREFYDVHIASVLVFADHEEEDAELMRELALECRSLISQITN